jgi:hypothetical protein
MSNFVETATDEELQALVGPPAYDGEPPPPIAVLYTKEAETKLALASAARVAGRLNLRVSLRVLQVVPLPLPPDCSPVSVDFLKERMRELASSVDGEIDVEIILCRDELEALRRVLGARSRVFIGGKRSWWPGRRKRLCDALEGLGHRVIYVER